MEVESVHTQVGRVDPERCDRGVGDRPDESVGWGANAAGQIDLRRIGVIGGRVGQHPKDADGVGDHGDRWPVAQSAAQLGGGVPRDRDRLPSLTASAATAAIAAFASRCWAALTDDHGSSPRLCRFTAPPCTLQQIHHVQGVQVASHGHLRDVEFGGQIGDAHRTAGVQRPQDCLLTFGGEHRRPSGFCADRPLPNTAQYQTDLISFSEFSVQHC